MTAEASTAPAVRPRPIAMCCAERPRLLARLSTAPRTLMFATPTLPRSAGREIRGRPEEFRPSLGRCVGLSQAGEAEPCVYAKQEARGVGAARPRLADALRRAP